MAHSTRSGSAPHPPSAPSPRGRGEGHSLRTPPVCKVSGVSCSGDELRFVATRENCRRARLRRAELSWVGETSRPPRGVRHGAAVPYSDRFRLRQSMTSAARPAETSSRDRHKAASDRRPWFASPGTQREDAHSLRAPPVCKVSGVSCSGDELRFVATRENYRRARLRRAELSWVGETSRPPRGFGTAQPCPDME
jgi:hypothetical protein